MKLNYSLSTIAKAINGKLYGDDKVMIQNLCIDTRLPINFEETIFVALNGVKTNGHQFCKLFIAQGGAAVIVEKKLDEVNNQIVVPNSLMALQQLAGFHRKQFKIPIIGITGSNGKTTVKEWLFHVFKSQFNICRSPKSYNSQIGVALSVLNLNQSHTLGIFEAGISQMGEMDKLEAIIKPTIGIYTGIGDAHQQNFKTLDDKINEKQKLFKGVAHLISNNTELIDLDIPFNDLASKQNANLVYKVAKLLKCDDSILISQLKTLPSISMRMEKMEGKNNCIILNDAYTLDEKSLEISVNYLNTINENKDKVLIIAPSENSYLPNEMIQLINGLTDYKIILIGDSKSFISNVEHHFKSIEDYLQKQIEFKDSAILLTGSRQSKLERIIPTLIAKKHITKLAIDLSAIRNNLNYYRSRLNPNTEILAMVKAQSYGGGIVDIAKFLQSEKVNYFGVAYADEGVILRENNIDLPILVMNPEPEAFDDIIKFNLEPSIYSFELLDAFIVSLIRQNKKSFPIHLKFDTGMNRLGFSESDVNELLSQLNAQPEVYVKSIFSHLAVADDLSEKEFTNKQLSVYKTIIKNIKNALNYDFKSHIANSAGALNYAESQLDMVRLGIGLYGLLDEKNTHFRSALSFHTQISQIKYLSKGDSVGYGRVYKAVKNEKIAIIPVGYADGLRRELSQGKWSVLINGQLAPIVGNICMDMCMVNVTEIDCKPETDVQIFGEGNSVFQMAKTLKTIPYEIISAISSRVHRVYIEE